jgi:hypothetical protein
MIMLFKFLKHVEIYQKLHRLKLEFDEYRKEKE